MMIRVQYFAIFREQRGVSTETIETMARTPIELYRELGLTLDESLVKVAIAGAFVPMDSYLKEGDHVVFIPPVAGG